MPHHRPVTPIIWLSCGLLGGQLAAPWTTGWAFVAAAITAGVFAIARSPTDPVARAIAAAAIAAALGHCQLDARLDPELPLTHIARLGVDRAIFRATVAERPSHRPSGLRLVLQVDGEQRGHEWTERSGRILLTVRNAQRDWHRGDRLVARIRMRAPRNFGNPGEFDYEHHLARRGIYTTGFSVDDEDWRRLPRAAAPTWADSVHRHATATLDQVAPPHLRAIAAALLLGDSASIPPDIRRRYARAGVSHVLAISGLHIGLVAAGVYTGMRWLLARSEYALLALNVPKLATAASLPPVLAYASIAGAGAATLRATVMGSLLIAALLIDRPRHWPATLAAAAAAVCATSPGAAFEASFQLSFAAVIAIVAGGRRLCDAYDTWAERHLWRLSAPRLHRFGRWLVLSQGITLTAMLATAPLTLYHFQQLSLVGAISNLVIVPITGMGAVGIGLAAVLLNPWLPGVGGALFAACCGLLAVGDALTTVFASLPGADLHLPTPTTAEIATYYALLAAFLIRPLRARGAVVVLAAAAALIALQIASWHVERVTSDEMRVTFVSVGQGDSTLVEFPGGHVMLVDGGGLSPTFDVGERVIAPLLLRRKIRTIDTIVLTHPDFDHYGGLGYIAQRFAVDEIWTNGGRSKSNRYQDFLDRVASTSARTVIARRGEVRTIGGVEVRVLHPQDDRADGHQPDGEQPDGSNDASITLLLSFGGARILLTGDLEADGERALLRQGDDLRGSILKVPHHGSRTSSTASLLKAVEPSLAIISSGFGNRYRLPHPDVLDRYRQRAIRVIRTDLDGAIEIRIAPSGTTVVTKGRRWRRSAISESTTTGTYLFRLTDRETAT